MLFSQSLPEEGRKGGKAVLFRDFYSVPKEKKADEERRSEREEGKQQDRNALRLFSFSFFFLSVEAPEMLPTCCIMTL